LQPSGFDHLAAMLSPFKIKSLTLEIDNNIAERGVAVGRRKWLFAGSRAGG
jgi:hypothetical protein